MHLYDHTLLRNMIWSRSLRIHFTLVKTRDKPLREREDFIVGGISLQDNNILDYDEISWKDKRKD